LPTIEKDEKRQGVPKTIKTIIYFKTKNVEQLS